MKPLNDQVSNEYSCLMIFVGERWRGSVCHGQIGAKLLILVLKSGGHFCTKEPNLWTYKTYLSHCVCDYCCWNGFQKAKKTSGGGTHKYDESTVRTTDFSPYFFLGKWPLKPLLGIVCSLSGLKGVFITNFSVPSCSKLRRKQRHVWNAHWTMHRGKWTLLILLAAASILQSQTQTNFSSGFCHTRGFHL